MATLQVIHVSDSGTRIGREINLSRPVTFAERIAAKGLDEKHQIQLLRRRARYAQSCDRPKLFANDSVVGLYTGYLSNGQRYTPDQASRDLSVLRTTCSTADYVAAWCRLNHLKEAA